MLMDSFEVENFRSLKHLKLEKLARVNLLVGKNNSGKTSVLEAIYSLIGVGSTAWLDNITRARGLSMLRIDYAQLFYKLDVSKEVRLVGEYREGMSGGDYMMWLRVLLSSNNLVAQQDYADLDWESERSSRQADNEGTMQISVQSDAMTRSEKHEIFSAGAGMPRFRIRGDVPVRDSAVGSFRSSGLFRTRSTFISSHSYVRASNTSLERLKIVKADNQLVDVLRQVDGRIERVELVRGIVYFNLGSEFPNLLPINLMGEGMQRLVLIISTIISRAGGFVLIDEIDNGLHYSVLRILWRTILQTAQSHDVQLIISTHSAEALRHLTWVLDDDCKEYRGDVAAYTLIRADDDTVRTYRHDYEQLDYALDHGLEIRN
jgi:energy-coupling factor transporter ATP-binding protein EcfA2